MSDDHVEITVTVKIPPDVILEMQKAALQASLQGAAQAQAGLVTAWTGIWSQAAENAQSSFLKMFQVPGQKYISKDK